MCGHLFVFRGRGGGLIKVIWHDGQGACLFTKKLERGRFVWPSAADGSVVITPAQPPDLMPLLALGYRLTQREQDVLQFLARGMSTAEMTQQLGISPHTVRDHIKSLFGKVGVSSRAELVARIFAEHYFDRLEADVDRPS